MNQILGTQGRGGHKKDGKNTHKSSGSQPVCDNTKLPGADLRHAKHAKVLQVATSDEEGLCLGTRVEALAVGQDTGRPVQPWRSA